MWPSAQPAKRKKNPTRRNSPKKSTAKRQPVKTVSHQPLTLFQTACNVVGGSQPYELVEIYHNRVAPVPEEVQLAIMKAAFPCDKEIIRQYAYLARKTTDSCSDLKSPDGSSPKTRSRGAAVASGCGNLLEKNVVQIGFVLTGSFMPPGGGYLTSVSISFDRRHITWMACSQHRHERHQRWCQHAVQLIFHRIDHPDKVKYCLPVSTSIQQLNQMQEKQLLNMLLSRFQLEILPFAQEMVDKLLKRSKGSPEVLDFPDPTAGAAIDATPYWCIGDSELRRLVELYCEKAVGAGRCVPREKVSSQEMWMLLVKQKPQGVKGLGLGKDRMFKSCKNLDMVVQLVMSMLKKGEQSAHEALRSITDEWLCWLAEKATNCGHRAQTKGILVKMDTKGNSLNNKDLLSPVASPWFLPDQIINCWRLTVLCPKFASSSSFCDDLLVEHEDNASFLGDTLTQVKKCVQVSPKHKQLWESLFGWKGFEHIQVLTNYNAQEIMSRASQLHAGGLQGSVNSQSIMDGSFLWTAACFIECLLFYGYTEAAAELAGGCLELLIGVHPKESGIVTDGLSEGLEEVNLLLSIISLHEENVDMLWGGECCENLLVPLMVAYRALEGCVGPWASRMWHLSGVLPAVSFDGDELVISCSLPVVVAVVCCLLPDVVMSVTSQIDVITEKTRIINSVVKCIPNTVRPSLLASLTKMLLSLSRHECNGRFVDMTGMIQLLLSIVEVSQHEYQSDQRSSERLTVSEELASVIRQQTGSEALQSVFSGRDTQPLVYARFTRLISLVLLAVKTSGSLVSVIKSVLDPLLEKGIASLPLGHQHFLSLLVDLVDVIQYNAGLKVAQQGSTLCERLKLLSCCVETLLAQQSVKEGESKKVRSRSSMEGLFLVLRADRMVDGRSCGFRHKALGLLEEIQKDVPGPLILEMMQLFGWKSILHGAEFLFRLLAKKSFQASFQSLKGGTGMKALGEVVSEAAAEVAEGECDDLLRCARKLNLIDLLFQSSLTSGSDLNKSGSAVLLFQLCRESEGDNKQQLQLGFLALRQWKNRLSRPREPPLNGDVFESLMCHNEPDLRCVLGLMWVCALAVYTDMIPTRTLGKAKPVKMVTINRLFTEVSERWIDPLVSYHVLMEVARLWGHFFEVQNLVKNPPKGDHKTGMDLEPPAVLAEHENMLRDPGGLSSVQSLCQRLPSAKQLAEKCKQGFVEGIKMATGSHSGLSAGGSSATTAQCNFIPHRHLILGDLVALDFISKAVPFPDVNVMALVDESDGCSMCPDFQEVCSEFKKLVGLMKRFPSGPTEEQKARMKFLQFMSMSGQMLAEAGFNVFGSSSDDES